MDFDNQIENQLRNYLCMQRVISNQTVWHAQTGGQTNKVWRLIGEEDLICKLYLETGNNPLFKNTPEEEYRCLLWLEGSNIAPKPYKFLKTPFGEVLIYNYIKGQIWSHNVDSVSELLTRIRKHIYPKGLRVLSNLPSDIKQIGLEIINELNSYHKNKLIKICPDVSIPDIEPVLLQTDVVPGNLKIGRAHV